LIGAVSVQAAGAATNAGPGNDAADADSPPSSGADTLAEIVVTANRREETIQKSSVVVSAFNDEALKSAGISQAADLTKLVQGLQVGFSGSTSQIYIRGLGDFSANPLANPGVAFNVDGVYVGRPEGVGVNFYDITRVEVLKGPQGTLYGRNSSGGAINVITNSPSLDRVSGDLNGDFGNYSLYHIDGAINIPVNDKIAVRAAFNRIKRDGYLTDDTGDDDQLAARVRVLVQATDDFSFLLSADGAQVRGKGGGYVYFPRRPGSDPWEGSSSPAANAWVATFNPLIVPGGSDAFVHNNFLNGSGELHWNLGFAELTGIGAYRHTNTDTLSYNAQSQHLLGHSEQWTGELRLSHSNDLLKWVGGLYYFQENDPGEIRIFVGPGLLKSKPVYDPAGTSYAAFGEATFSVTDSLRLIAGARYTREKRTLSGDFYVYPTQGDDFIDLEPFGGEKTFQSGTWKAGLEYDIAPQNMLYFTASTGFKAGGLTQTVPPGNVYQPEKVLAFELGSRNRFFDNRLQANFELFHWTYSDQQNSHLTFDTLGNINFLTQNAGRAHIYGANVDLQFRPTSADLLAAAAEYDHSKYSNFSYPLPIFAYTPTGIGCANAGVSPGPFVPLVTVDCSGFPLPHSPLWTGQLSYTHSIDIGSNGSIDISASGRFSSGQWLAVDFIPTEHVGSYSILNASIAYRAASGAYSVEVYGRNLNNGREYTGAQEQNFAPPLVSANIGAPRTYGVQLHWTYK
jgi:iron complex outermembrane receptor protein